MWDEGKKYRMRGDDKRSEKNNQASRFNGVSHGPGRRKKCVECLFFQFIESLPFSDDVEPGSKAALIV
jgi:hypothetical protein